MAINSEPKEEKHLMRRAITLRSLLNEHRYLYPRDSSDGIAMVDDEVIYALLTVDRYRHGVRSMEQILQMCTPIDGRIRPGSLPSRAQLDMHVDAANFYIRLYNGRARRYVPSKEVDLARSAERASESSPPSTRALVTEAGRELSGGS